MAGANMKRVVILGAGTGGTIMANRIWSQHKKEVAEGDLTITVVDQDNRHVYQPGLLFIPFDVYRPKDTIKERKPFLPKAANFILAEVDRVESEEDKVYLANGKTLDYDLLIIATGARLAPEETEGLMGQGWGEKMFEFYTQEGAEALAPAMREFKSGHLVVNITEMPIKCPIAPLEFVFLSDWYFRKRGIRDDVRISLVTPLDAAFTRPLAAHAFGNLLNEKNIEIVTEFSTGEVDGNAGQITSWDERTVDFDLLVNIPLHMGAEFVDRSPGLGDDMGWVLTDPNTLQAQVKENIFVLGDATNVATSKAGSVAHFQGEVLAENVERFLNGQRLKPEFDGHANCFIETGDKKAVLIDFNYDIEPLPGRFPFAAVGPLSLLKETRMNHAGKMAFKWVYWNMLLPGKDLPGVTTQMTLRGKRERVKGFDPQTADV
jgi:sulfide:quinone oxidoreductase